MLEINKIIKICQELDSAGLLWSPEIGDEIALREDYKTISILVDPQGLTPSELRHTYLWLPTLEQLVLQFEARQALIEHVGMNAQFVYEAVIQTDLGKIEVEANNLRVAFGQALTNLLEGVNSRNIQ